MAYTPTPIVSGYNSETTLNQNFADIKTAIDDSLSKSGDGANSLTSDLDLNSNDLLNGGNIYTSALYLDGKVVGTTLVEAVEDASLINYTPTGGSVTTVAEGLDASAVSLGSKAAAVITSPINNKPYLIEGSDGGWFIGITGAAPGTYADDGGSQCGTVFIPTGGDGSSAWIRRYQGSLQAHWFLPNGYDATGATNYSTEIGRAITATGIGGALSFYGVKYATIGVVDLRPLDYQTWYLHVGVTLKQPNLSSQTGSGIITISAKAGVHILGAGRMDGNKANNTYAVRPSGWPWHGIVISSASTDCVVDGPFIYDCEEPVHGTGDNSCIVVRANSRRNTIQNVRLKSSNNNLMLYNAHETRVDNVLIEDNTLSEGLAIFNDGSTESRINNNVLSNIIFKTCRQGVAINESSGNTVTNVINRDWVDNALSVRAGGNTIDNYHCIAGPSTTGQFSVSITGADGGTTDVRADKTVLTSVVVDQQGTNISSSNAFQISNNKEFPVTLNVCKAMNSVATWEATTDKAVGDIIIPTTLDGYQYECTTAGTTGGTEPTFTASTSDGSVTWTRQTLSSSSGYNINAAKGVKLIGCEAQRMAGSGYKLQSWSENVDFIDCDSTENNEYGMLVNGNGIKYGSVQGGRYNNNNQGGTAGAGILVSDTGNYGFNLDNEVTAIDTQRVPTQATNGVSVGANTGNFIVGSAPPERGIWNLGQRVQRRNTSGSAQGYYVFGRTDTTVNTNELTGQTSITVASITGIADGDTLGILLDDDSWHWSTVNGAPSGTTVVITDALPSAAGTGARFITHEWVEF